MTKRDCGFIFYFNKQNISKSKNSKFKKKKSYLIAIQNYKNNKVINKFETDCKSRISIYSEMYTYYCIFIFKVNSIKRYVT